VVWIAPVKGGAIDEGKATQGDRVVSGGQPQPNQNVAALGKIKNH